MTAKGIRIIRGEAVHAPAGLEWARWRLQMLGERKADVLAETTFTGTRDQAWSQAETFARRHGWKPFTIAKTY